MNKRYWAILIVYIFMHLSSLVGIPILVGQGVNLYESFIYWSMGSFVVALLIILFLLIPERTERRLHPRLRKTTVSHAMKWAIIGVFLAFVAQFFAIFIETELLGIEPGSENTQEIIRMIEVLPVFAIIVAMVGPVLEEIVFRKIIFGALYKKFNFFLSALLSAVIFAVVHFDFTHILIYTAVGFVFSLLYVKTGRIIVPIIAHVAMNGYAVLVQVLLVDYLEDIQKELEQLQFILGGLLL